MKNLLEITISDVTNFQFFGLPHKNGLNSYFKIKLESLLSTVLMQFYMHEFYVETEKFIIQFLKLEISKWSMH